MRINFSRSPMYFTAVSVVCAVVSAGSLIVKNTNSDRAAAARSKAQRVVAQHVLSKTCWSVNATQLAIGDEISTKGRKVPTACFKNKTQYAYAGYLRGKLQILQVFSPYEVQVTKYNIKAEK